MDSNLSVSARRAMTEVSVRDLRNQAGDVLDSVLHGESVTVTRHGGPVAELRPIAAPGALAATMLGRWHAVPVLDLAALRPDLDEVLDPSP